jgi:uncharacterized Zn finger protein (UPF0148 family)
MNDVQPILCGKCKITPKRGFERDGEMWASCPVCGREDRIADIQREAAEYHTDKAVRDTLSGVSANSMTVKSPPQREYRWITGW